MPTLESNIPGPLDFGRAFGSKVFAYDLRLEVAVEDDTEQVPIHDVMKSFLGQLENAVEYPVEIMDIKGTTVHVTSLPEGDEFQKRFGVEVAEGKKRKLVLGFKMKSQTSLSGIKQRMLGHLRDNRLFLRTHAGGYQHGVNYVSLGYLREENPTTSDVKKWEEIILREMNVVWKNSNLVPESTRKQVIEKYPRQVTKNKVSFPISIEKGKVIAIHSNKKKIDAVCLMITTPRQFALPVRKLLEGARASTTMIDQFVPNALRKEDPDLYFKVLASHAKYVYNHRNIQIHNIVPERFHADIQPTLDTHKAILRVYVDKDKARANISTDSANYLSLGAWLDDKLSSLQLAYNPYRANRKDGNSVTSNNSTTTKFSHLFRDDQSSSSEASSFDPSTIKSTRTNAWAQRLPLKISYSNVSEFPPLQAKNKSGSTPATETILTDNTDTISAMIESAVKKVEQEQAQRLEELTKSMNERMLQLENSLSAIVTKVVEATYASMTNSGAFATKDDHIQLKAESYMMNRKLDSILESMTKVNSPPRKSSRKDDNDNLSSALLIADTAMDLGDWKGKESNVLPEETTTIAFQNIHGIHTSSNPLETTVQELVANMDEYNISIIGLSEHNIAMQNGTWRRRLYEGINKTRPGRILHQFDSGPEHDTSGRLVGGTGLIACDEITGRVEHRGKGGDPMGRWSFLHLRRYRMPPLTVISVYQVCPQPSNVIGNTAWHQQRRFLDLQRRSSEHPRDAFITDLTRFISELQRKQHAIIVGGDWNDWLMSDTSKVIKMCTTLHLVDPWVLKNPQTLDFATHENGSHRIDAVFVSESIQQAITSIQYSPVGLFGTTDHRAVVVGFRTQELFGSKHIPLSQPSARLVFSKDKQSVTTFIEKMYQHLLHNNAFQRSMKLDLHNPTDWTLAENLDKLIGEAGDMAESRCRRRRPQWYSNSLVKARQCVSLMRHHLYGLQARVDRSKVIQQRLLNIGENVVLSMEMPEVRARLQEYQDKLHQLNQDHEGVRWEELRTSAEAAEAAGSDSKARAIRGICKSEQNLKTWKILQFMTSADNAPRLDRLEIPSSWPEVHSLQLNANHNLEDPKTATEWRVIHDPQEIEYYLMVRNYQHFGQAQGTPFTVGPLSETIDWSASSRASEEILTGTFTDRDNISNLCMQVLEQCQRKNGASQLSPDLTQSELKGKIMTWDERTTTSPSGRHLGRYKAMYAQSSHAPGSKQSQEFERKQEKIQQLILRLLNYCIHTGHPLQRWCQVVNTMIFKDPGIYKVHRLRVIHIFEADLNLLYAIKWRQLIQMADRNNQIHPGQYGGRPGYEATSMALMEELKMEATYLTRRSLITFDNDAASCYDRIVINMASLVNRRNGMPKQITNLHGRILQTTQYKIRTALGVSNISYVNHPERPLYGTGQGASNSPGTWLLISSLLFEVYDKSCIGSTFTAQDGSIVSHIGLCGFVDDTNATTNTFHPQDEPDIHTLLAWMQADAQLRTNLLHVAGGKLELGKCSYQVLTFDFQPNGTPIATKQQYPPMMLFDPTTGGASEVPYIQATEAHKILGHWKSPADRHQKRQLQAIVEKANTLSLLISTSPISQSGAGLAYKGKYVSSLRYILPQCWFPPQVLRKRERLSMARIISKCGCAKTTPHALIYAPTEFAGAGMVHWDTLQGEGQVKNFIKHWRTETAVSHMLRIAVSWAQWQAGLSVSILTNVSAGLPHVEGRWLLSLRKFLQSIHGSIQLDQDFVPGKERQGDQYIMEVARESGQFNDDDMRVLNYCRMYLHVTTISELCNAGGTHMLQHMFECHRPLWFDRSVNTVLQKRPSAYQIQFQWRRFCRQLCQADLTLAPWIQLHHWTVPANSLRLRREAYRSRYSTGTVYIWHEDRFWKASPYRGSSTQYVLETKTDWLPTVTSIPIDVQLLVQQRYIITEDALSRYRPDKDHHLVHDFEDYVLQLPKWAQRLLQNIIWHKYPHEIMQFLQSLKCTEKLLIVSDGSCNKGWSMSYGLIIGTSSGDRLMEANGPADGQISSHRAECTGCLAGALLLHHIQQYTGTTLPGDLAVATLSDNQGMITRLCDRQTYCIAYANSTLAPDWDLIEEIHQVYQNMRLSHHTYEWVRGHQDSATTHPLSVEAQYNVSADQLAGEFFIMRGNTICDDHELRQHTKCRLYIQGQEIQGHYGSHIHRAVARPGYMQYLRERHGWDEETIKDIDWDLFYKSTRNHDSSSIHLMKLVHDKLPTNLQKSKYTLHVDPRCTFCPHPDTFEHICLGICNERSIQFRTDLESAIMKLLKDTTPRPFQRTFQCAIKRWFASSTGQSQVPWEGPQWLLRHQQQIGWAQMFRGFFTRSWSRFLKETLRRHRVLQWLNTNGQSKIQRGEQYQSQEIHNPYTAPRRTILPTQIKTLLSRIVREVWHHMGKLWRSHTQHIHASSQLSASRRHQELQSEIRAMHLLREQTLAAHRDQYFYSQVEKFVSNASNSQMARYIQRYRPVILNSIRQATKAATQSRPIHEFFAPRNTNRPSRNSPPHPALEEPPHRKHTRRRHPTVARITDFFTSKKNTTSTHT